MTRKENQIRISIGSFNFAKGLSMILIILVHAMKTDHYVAEKLFFFRPATWLFYLGSFVIPMFFLISGFGFKPKSPLTMLKKTVSELILPYLWVMLAIIVVYPLAFAHHTDSWQEALNVTVCYTLAYVLGIPEYGKVIFGYGVAWISAVWYLLALFVAFNVLNLILRHKNTVVQSLLVILSVLVGYLLVVHDICYYCIPQGLMAVGYCYIGYLIKQYRLIERLLHHVGWNLLLLLIAVAHMIWGHFDLCLGEFNYGLLDFIAAGCGGMLLIHLSVLADRLENRVLSGIKTIGTYSYWILCIHSVEVGLPHWASLVDAMGEYQDVAMLLEFGCKISLITAVCAFLKKVTQFRYRRKMLQEKTGFLDFMTSAPGDRAPAKQKGRKITLNSFSMIRGLAIVLVMLIHLLLLIPYNTENAPLIQIAIDILWSFGFLMPLFFMISGYSFKPKPVKKMLSKTFSEAIVPCLWVLAAIVVVYPVAFYFKRGSWAGSLSDTLHFFLGFLLGVPEYGTVFLGYHIAWMPAVWYFLALFVAFNILNLILKIDNTSVQFLLVLGCVLLGYQLSIWEFNYYCLSRGLLAVGYCYFGYISRTHKLLERYMSSFWFYLIVTPVSLVYLLFGFLNLASGDSNYGMLDFIGAGFAAVLFMYLGVYLGQFDWKATDWLKQVGIYNYWILCIHGVEMEIPQWTMIAAALPEHQYLAFFINGILKTILVVTCCFALKKLSHYRYKRRMLARGK